MAKIYFTVTGTNFRYGTDFTEPKMEVKLTKEPDNDYDKIDDTAKGKVKYVLENGLLCELVTK